VVIEDDYNEFSDASHRRLPVLTASTGGADHVIYVGTFSKTLFPSLRIGFAVVPQRLIRSFLSINATPIG